MLLFDFASLTCIVYNIYIFDLQLHVLSTLQASMNGH